MTLATLFLATAIAASISPEAPQNWKRIETSDDSPYKLFVNVADVVHEGSVRLFIARMVPDAPADAPEPPEIASILVLIKLDCSANTIETQSASMVDQSGELSDLGGNPQRAIAPGTDDMMMQKMVCHPRQSSPARRRSANNHGRSPAG